jgi:hypothetical protein
MAKQLTIHVLRSPLPWRPSRLTECGLLAEKVRSASPGDALKLTLTGGKNLVCESCVQLCSPYRQETPLEREIAWSRRSRRLKDHFIDFELQALGLLVARYQDEFDRLVAALLAEQVILKGRD